jgi:CubicO group peptidase (beta-lactamase class C family)
MQLTVTGLGGSIPIVFTRIADAPYRLGKPRLPGHPRYRDEAPRHRKDGWRTATAASAGLDTALLDSLVHDIVSRELELVHSILIARRGKLVFEEYFYGFHGDLAHDTRSASKTIAAALVGAAIDKKYLSGVDARVLSLLPGYRQLDNWDARKAQIRVEDLLRMASGLDADDANDESVAAEWRYQSQSDQPDWTRYVLNAPMIDDPGAQPLYGSANPMILGAVLQSVLREPVELFAHRVLFEPLGVEHYKFFLDPLDNVYLGGGMHLRPRDLAKFGQMHLDDGMWNGKRILTKAYVRRSMAKHGQLANTRDRNEYGYLWWHRDYVVSGRSFASIEARGFGGQFLCVVPKLELVAVINSGNYRSARREQPEQIMERFIVPAAVKRHE